MGEYDKPRRSRFGAPISSEKLMNKGTGTYLAIIGCAVLAVVVFFVADFSGGKDRLARFGAEVNL